MELPTYAFQHRRYWPEPKAKTPDQAPARTVSAADGEPAESTDDWRFMIEWAHAPEPAPVLLSGTWLVLAQAGRSPHPCVQALAARGAETVTVEVDTADPDRTAYAARIAAASGDTEPAGVISLLALDAGPLDKHPAVPRGLAATLAVIQALGDTGTGAPLWVLTAGAVTTDHGGDHGTGGADGLRQAPVWALGRTAAAEHPDRWGGLIDLPPDPERFGDRDAVRLAAVLAARDENEVALRAGGLRRRRLVHAPKPPRPEGRRRLMPRGTVLVTGGTGHIGGHAARWLAADRGARRFVLTSRSGPSAPGTAALAADLAAAGAAVDVVACDTADRPALAAVLDRIAATGPELSTVLHAAGALDDGVLDRLSPARLASTFDGKAGGADALDELTAGLDLDAFVLCSSISATFGNGGQGNYAAANAHLDALAERRRARGLPAVSLAWGPWAGGGVGQASEGARRRLARNKWEVLMEPADAVRALAAAVDDPDPRNAVLSLMAVDFAAMATARGAEQLRRAPLMRDMPELRAAAADTPAADPEPADAAGVLAARLAPLPSDEARERLLRDLVRDEAAMVMGYASAADVEPGRAFSELGLDSLTSVELRNRLGAVTGLALPASLLYDHPDPLVLAAHLRTLLSGTGPDAAAEPAAGAAGANRHDDPVVIVSMGCRLPGGVHNPEQLWRLLDEGGDAVTGLPTDRGWDLDALYDPDPDRPGTLYARGGGFLHEAAEFDAGFFGISPREALAMDPQQRLLLEVVWETLERGGIDPARLRGSRTGVFVGAFGSGYDHLTPTGTAAADGADARLEGQAMIGTATSVLSGRVSYLLGLEGPAFTVDTACSSSLVALHSACQALRAGECDLAVVGGVTVMPTPRDLIGFSRQRGLAADGRCKAFDAGADGMGMAEGVAVIAVERLSDARRNGHTVLATVRGSAVNQDGASNGLTAPSGPSQQRVIRAALAAAGLAPGDVDAVEAHGTGTELGDPIEAQALLATYGRDRPADRPLWLGSVKSNIGHTQAAAGVAGIMKTVLALRHGVLPRTLHVDTPTPHVDWSAGHVELLRRPVAWPPRDDRRRRASVSSFGVSGTNAHVVIEEPPALRAETEPRPETPAEVRPGPVLSGGPVAWPVTARGAAALAAQASRLREFALARPDLPTRDVAWSLATTRPAFEHRAVAIGTERLDLAAGLAAAATGQTADGLVTGAAAPGGTGRTVFVFPGHGSQWAGMGRDLAEVSPVFRERLAECAAALAPHVEWDLDDVLAGRHDFRAADVLQPAVWAVSVALAEVWRAAGVEPDAVIGHSLGEIAAATVAGALTLEDGAKVAALRSRALRTLDGRGGMLSVAESAGTVREWLAGFEGRLSLATVNGPRSCVVSGDPDALDEFAAACPPTCRTTRVPIDYASHSVHVEELRDEILSALAGIEPRETRIPMMSAFTAEWLAGPDLDADYWYASLRGTVEFEKAVRALGDGGHGVFVEASGHPALIGAVDDTLGGTAVVTGTLRRGDGGARRLLTSLATAYASGVPVDWAAVHGPATTVELPTYAFQRTRYWPEPVRPAAPADDPLSGLRYRITWTRAADRTDSPALSGTWLLVGDDPAAAPLVHRALTGHGADVVAVPDAAAARAAEGDIAGVVSLLALDEAPYLGHPTMTRGMAATLGLVQCLGERAPEAPLWVLTRGAVATGPGEVGDPAQAQVWGLGRVVGVEHPERWGGLVDLPPAWDERTGARLAALLSGAVAEDQAALRPQGVLARRLVRAAGPPAQARPGRGTALVTGGTGVFGAEVGRWLAGRGAERVVLATDGPLTADVARLAADVAAVGAELSVAACDTTRRADLVCLLERLTADGGPALRSVVHAEGVGQDTPVADITAEELADIAGARAAGARWLDELTADLDLDDFVLFSSVAATWGSALVSGYAAGSAFVDAVAERRRARGQAAVSVAWGPWDGGSSTQTSVRHGLSALDPRTAVRALDEAVDGGPLVTIADVDWRSFAPAFTLYRPSPLLADLPEAADPAPARAGADDAPEFARTLAALPAARRLTAATDLVRGEAARVLSHEGAADIDAERAFRELGFDSLTAIELRNRLTAATGATLPSTVVFEHPTPAALAAHLLHALGVGPQTVSVELDHLDAALSGLLERFEDGAASADGDGEESAAIAARLAALSDKWRRLRQRATGTGPDVSQRLADAGDDEVFDLLGKEFGIE
ncbi:type I polyketide synthase [Actinomadura sp. WAC 06369]|uniref:type I polyketide synthase n=1 Tax=Actinomadura sp. WAC 06369 TaxID=2203193 RepID=UPI0018F54EFF|nr:type I polyketide synthase [Actinomadura sp. WAC 06369]